MKPKLYMREERNAIDLFAAFMNVNSMDATESNFDKLRKEVDRAEKRIMKEVRMKRMKGVSVGRHPYFQKRGSFDGEKMVVALRIDFNADGMEYYDEMSEFIEGLGFVEKSMAVAASQSCRNIIMTGPPGSGKTTLLKRFKGIARIVDEVAREVIKERDAKGWGRGNIQPEIYERTLREVEQALGSEDDFIVFDRTHVDCLAFGYVPEEPPKPIEDAEVWVLKHHPEWYVQDEQRKETAEEAIELGEKLKKVYRDLGYSVREIDAADPETWPVWVRKRLERRKTGMQYFSDIQPSVKGKSTIARTTNNRGLIKEFDYDRPVTHLSVKDVMKGVVEDMEEVVKNRKLMADYDDEFDFDGFVNDVFEQKEREETFDWFQKWAKKVGARIENERGKWWLESKNGKWKSKVYDEDDFDELMKDAHHNRHRWEREIKRASMTAKRKPLNRDGHMNLMLGPDATKAARVFVKLAIRLIAEGKKRMSVYDFDDTLVSSESSVSVGHGDGEMTILDSASFAYFKPIAGDTIDFSDFNNVTRPRIIKNNMDALKKDYADENTRVVILTARPKGSASAVKKFMNSLDIDIEVVALQSSDPMDKAKWIQNEAGDAEEVEFTDDSSANAAAVATLSGNVPFKVTTKNPPHPKEEDYEGGPLSEIFDSDAPTSAKVEIPSDSTDKKETKQDDSQDSGNAKPEEKGVSHSQGRWWKEQSPAFQKQYCIQHPSSGYCSKAASIRGFRMTANYGKTIEDRAKKVKSSKVKAYVKNGLIPKMEQSGVAAGAWLEQLESDFDKLKPQGLMQGFKPSDFDDLWFVLTGEKKKKSSIREEFRMTAKKKPLNRDRRMKQMLEQDAPKQRGEMPPPTKRFKDKTKYDRKRQEKYSMDKVKIAAELVKLARELVSWGWNDFPDESLKMLKDNVKKALRVMTGVSARLKKQFPDREFTEAVLDGHTHIWIGSRDKPEREVVGRIELEVDPVFIRETGRMYNQPIDIESVNFVLRVWFGSSGYSNKTLKTFTTMPTASQIMGLLMTQEKRMHQRVPGKFDVEAIRKFMDKQRTWFEEDDADDSSISFSTRDNGNVGDEEPGEVDLDEARHLVKLLRAEYPDLRIDSQEVDEWVFVTIST